MLEYNQQSELHEAALLFVYLLVFEYSKRRRFHFRRTREKAPTTGQRKRMKGAGSNAKNQKDVVFRCILPVQYLRI